MQDVVPPPGVAVEVLHEQPPPAPAVGPGRELRLGASRSRGRRAPRTPGRRSTKSRLLHDVGAHTLSGSPHPVERLGVGADLVELGLVAQLGGAVAQRGEDAGAAFWRWNRRRAKTARDSISSTGWSRPVEEVRTQLVGEAPAPGPRCVATGSRRARGRVTAPPLPPADAPTPPALTSGRTSSGRPDRLGATPVTDPAVTGTRTCVEVDGCEPRAARRHDGRAAPAPPSRCPRAAPGRSRRPPRRSATRSAAMAAGRRHHPARGRARLAPAAAATSAGDDAELHAGHRQHRRGGRHPRRRRGRGLRRRRDPAPRPTVDGGRRPAAPRPARTRSRSPRDPPSSSAATTSRSP